MQWDVPLDDQHSLGSGLRRLPLTAEAVEAYRTRHAASIAEPKISWRKWARQSSRVNYIFQELDSFFRDKISLVHSQDYVAQVGQGPLTDRAQEHLGRSDIGVILFRKIWERELRALAE